MIKVVIVDDSAFMRRKIAQALAANQDIVVVGEAADPYEARGVINAEKPDVITLDIEMPRMDGLTFLRKLMTHHPMPVVVCSSLTRDGSAVALEALRLGAVEVISKPTSEAGAPAFKMDMVQALVGAAAARGVSTSRLDPAQQRIGAVSTGSKVVCMAGSTGAAVAVEEILLALPARCPPIVVAQHLPAKFIETYAQKLDQNCSMRVREANDGDLVEAGQVLIAPGDRHLILTSVGGKVVVNLKQGPRVNQHRPSSDLLFRSAVQSLGDNAVGVILTGTGADGVRGLAEMRKAGARTLAQGLSSCAVDLLPAAAVKAGAVEREVALHELPKAIMMAAGAILSRDVA